jgi:hypothetical protein
VCKKSADGLVFFENKIWETQVRGRVVYITNLSRRHTLLRIVGDQLLDEVDAVGGRVRDHVANAGALARGKVVLEVRG